MIKFNEQDAKDFHAFRNGTANPLKIAVLDLQPAEIDGRWFVISEETGKPFVTTPMANEKACWDWIHGIRIIE